MKLIIAYGLAGMLASGTALGPAEGLIAGYELDGAGPFSADAGRAAWQRQHAAPDGKGTRSCASCHGQDLRQAGKHVKTGKVIEPMAPSRNSQRLSNTKKVEKWLRRNCRWTLGRECTAQEKGDFVQFMAGQ